MWWPKRRAALRNGRVALALVAASLAGGCFTPLYGQRPDAPAADTVHDKLAEVDIPPIPVAKGQPVARIALQLHNALEYEFNGGAGPNAPTYRLNVSLGTNALSVIVDVTSGRPDAQVDAVFASYQLVEIATGKVVLKDTTFAHVDYDIPGAAQRFAKLRAQRDAEDRATGVIAEAIRNRLTSYFVAGT